MFTRQKSNTSEPTETQANADNTATPAQPLEPSLISPDATITGDIVSVGKMVLDGKLKGTARAFELVVGQNGDVDGDVIGDRVSVLGTVRGNIRGVEVNLIKGCNVRGNILHEQLSMESGAVFEGRIARAENPLSDEAARPDTLRDAGKAPPPKKTVAANQDQPKPGGKKPAPKEDQGPVVVNEGGVVVRSN